MGGRDLGVFSVRAWTGWDLRFLMEELHKDSISATPVESSSLLVGITHASPASSSVNAEPFEPASPIIYHSWARQSQG